MKIGTCHKEFLTMKTLRILSMFLTVCCFAWAIPNPSVFSITIIPLVSTSSSFQKLSQPITPAIVRSSSDTWLASHFAESQKCQFQNTFWVNVKTWILLFRHIFCRKLDLRIFINTILLPSLSRFFKIPKPWLVTSSRTLSGIVFVKISG